MRFIHHLQGCEHQIVVQNFRMNPGFLFAGKDRMRPSEGEANGWSV